MPALSYVLLYCLLTSEVASDLTFSRPQQCLCRFPLPQGQGSFLRDIFCDDVIMCCMPAETSSAGAEEYSDSILAEKTTETLCELAHNLAC